LKILAIVVLLVFVYTPSYQAMIVFDRQRTLSWALLSGAALNVVLNLALIPPYGLYGAAWATVATHAVLLCALVVFAGKSTPVRPLSGGVVRGLLGAGGSGGVAWAVMVLAKVPLWLGARPAQPQEPGHVQEAGPVARRRGRRGPPGEESGDGGRGVARCPRDARPGHR